MPFPPRTEVGGLSRLVVASALLWFACGKVQGGDEGLRQEGLKFQTLQVMALGQ